MCERARVWLGLFVGSQRREAERSPFDRGVSIGSTQSAAGTSTDSGSIAARCMVRTG